MKKEWKCANVKIEEHSYDAYLWINGIKYTIFWEDGYIHILTDEELKNWYGRIEMVKKK